MNPVGKGSVGSTVTVRVPKIQPRPEMLDTTAGRPPTDAVPSDRDGELAVDQ